MANPIRDEIHAFAVLEDLVKRVKELEEKVKSLESA